MEHNNGWISPTFLFYIITNIVQEFVPKSYIFYSHNIHEFFQNKISLKIQRNSWNTWEEWNLMNLYQMLFWLFNAGQILETYCQKSRRVSEEMRDDSLT